MGWFPGRHSGHKILAAVLASVIIVTMGVVMGRLRKTSRTDKPNILIISVCSLRWDFLNHGQPPPAIAQFYSHATVFKNAFNNISWSNISGFLSSIQPRVFQNTGYHAIGDVQKPVAARILGIAPGRPSYFVRLPRIYPGHALHFQRDLESIKRRMLERKNWPFLLEVHFKQMHEPYAYWHPGEPMRDAFPALSVKQRHYLADYLRHPLRFPARFPLYLYLADHGKHTLQLIKKLPMKIDPSLLKADEKTWFPKYIGLLTNPDMIRSWRRSPFYQNDVEILKAVYRQKLVWFDHYIQPLLLRFEDARLPQNTVVIFMGDHGEAFGEHGLFTHGQANFDEMLHFPLAVHFPGQKRAKTVTKQFYQGGVGQLVEGIMTGSVRADNFASFVKRERDDYIITHNCAKNEYGIRYKNKWKLIIDLASDEKRLFNLSDDPGETKNVEADHRDVSADLEGYWVSHLNSYMQNRMAQFCVGQGD